ncbi:MAG: hypothetical protein LUE27_08245 [Clostridia bacterium]|nr:hypothetical protein [Clostridia bacterium]
MLLDPKFERELSIYNRMNRDGMKRMLKKFGAKSYDRDEEGVSIMLRSILDLRHSPDIDEDEILERIRETKARGLDSLLAVSVFSALRVTPFYILEDSDGHIPYITIRMEGVDRKTLLIFTGEDAIPDDMRKSGQVRKVRMNRVRQALTEKQRNDFSAISINAFTDPLDISAEEFLGALDEMILSEAIVAMAYMMGVSGAELFPIFADLYVGFPVQCTLKNGKEAKGLAKSADWRTHSLIIENKDGAGETRISFFSISNINCFTSDEAMDLLKAAGYDPDEAGL